MHVETSENNFPTPLQKETSRFVVEMGWGKGAKTNSHMVLRLRNVPLATFNGSLCNMKMKRMIFYQDSQNLSISLCKLGVYSKRKENFF